MGLLCNRLIFLGERGFNPDRRYPGVAAFSHPLVHSPNRHASDEVSVRGTRGEAHAARSFATGCRAQPDRRAAYRVPTGWTPTDANSAAVWNTTPPRIVDTVCEMSSILASGSPSITTRSAVLPGAIEPTSLSWPM